ncbi:hypothetical protein ACO03_19305 [Pantoea ananatis]|nr:hypothetical protein ACO03_19305 [Pantoea ananatis]
MKVISFIFTTVINNRFCGKKKLFFFARVWQTHKLNILPYRIQSTYDVQLKAMMSFRLQQSRRFHYWLQLRKSF